MAVVRTSYVFVFSSSLAPSFMIRLYYFSLTVQLISSRHWMSVYIAWTGHGQRHKLGDIAKNDRWGKINIFQFNLEKWMCSVWTPRQGEALVSFVTIVTARHRIESLTKFFGDICTSHFQRMNFREKYVASLSCTIGCCNWQTHTHTHIAHSQPNGGTWLKRHHFISSYYQSLKFIISFGKEILL